MPTTHCTEACSMCTCMWNCLKHVTNIQYHFPKFNINARWLTCNLQRWCKCISITCITWVVWVTINNIFPPNLEMNGIVKKKKTNDMAKYMYMYITQSMGKIHHHQFRLHRIYAVQLAQVPIFIIIYLQTTAHITNVFIVTAAYFVELLGWQCLNFETLWVILLTTHSHMHWNDIHIYTLYTCINNWTKRNWFRRRICIQLSTINY